MPNCPRRAWSVSASATDDAQAVGRSRAAARARTSSGGCFSKRRCRFRPRRSVHPAQPTAIGFAPASIPSWRSPGRSPWRRRPGLPPSLDPRASDQRMSEQRPSDQRPPDQRGAARSAEAHPEVRSPAAPSRPIVLAAPKAHPIDDQPLSAPVPAGDAAARGLGTLRRIAARHGAWIDAAGAAPDTRERRL